MLKNRKMMEFKPITDATARSAIDCLGIDTSLYEGDDVSEYAFFRLAPSRVNDAFTATQESGGQPFLCVRLCRDDALEFARKIFELLDPFERQVLEALSRLEIDTRQVREHLEKKLY